MNDGVMDTRRELKWRWDVVRGCSSGFNVSGDRYDPDVLECCCTIAAELADEELRTINADLKGISSLLVLLREGDRVWLGSRQELRKGEDLSRPAYVYSVVARGKDATVLTDVTGALLGASRTWREIYGYEMGELMGQNPRLINSRLQSRRLFQEMWQALTDRDIGTWSAELLNRKKNGELVRVWQTITTVRDGNGAILGYLGQTRDLTDYVAAREQLRSQNEQLAELSRFKGEMLEVMAHDLKSPLQAVKGYGEMARLSLKRQDLPKLKDYLEGIDRTGASMLRLIQNFLELQRAEAGSLEIRPERVSVRDRLRSLVEGQAMAARQRGITVELHEEGPAAPVFLDPVRFEQAVSNTLSNAIKFAPAGSTVTVRLVSRAGFPDELLVEDEGPGIPEDQLEAVFLAHRQVEGQGNPLGSVGLGLAIARKIVEKHGGTLMASNRGAGGCRMRFEWPDGYEHFEDSIHSIALFDPEEQWALEWLDRFRSEQRPCFLANSLDVFEEICRQERPAVMMTGASGHFRMKKLFAPASSRELNPLRVERRLDGKWGVSGGSSTLQHQWEMLMQGQK